VYVVYIHVHVLTDTGSVYTSSLCMHVIDKYLIRLAILTISLDFNMYTVTT